MGRANNNNRVREPVAKCSVKISDYVKLDNGTAYLGFSHETFCLVNYLILDSWSFACD